MSRTVNPEIGDDQLMIALSPFGIRPSTEQIHLIREYISILLKWNKLISLTTVTSPIEIAGRHFGESMFVSDLLPVENCRLADVGTGAGFPGLALKILHPSLHVTLIESNKKKCAFLAEVVRSLNLSGIEIISERFEEIRKDPAMFDLVTARALGGFSELLEWAKQALAPRGHLVLWVGGEDATRLSSETGWIWRPAVQIPESQRRFILIGRSSI